MALFSEKIEEGLTDLGGGHAYDKGAAKGSAVLAKRINLQRQAHRQLQFCMTLDDFILQRYAGPRLIVHDQGRASNHHLARR